MSDRAVRTAFSFVILATVIPDSGFPQGCLPGGGGKYLLLLVEAAEAPFKGHGLITVAMGTNGQGTTTTASIIARWSIIDRTASRFLSWQLAGHGIRAQGIRIETS